MLIQPLVNHPQNIRSPHGFAQNSHRFSQQPLAVIGFILGFAEPREEGSDGLQGHALPLLFGGVFAGLPLVEGLLFDHVFIVECVEEHSQQI